MSAIKRLRQFEHHPVHPQFLRTNRLLLRQFVAADEECLATILSDEEVAVYIGGPKSSTEARDALMRMHDAFGQRGWGTFAIVPTENPRCIGYCGVRPLPCTSDVEVAFALDKSEWGKGYGTEAATAAVDAAFEALGFESVVGTVYPSNLASKRVLEKLGMHFEKEVFGFWPREIALLYRVTRSEWMANRISMDGVVARG